MMRRGFWLAAGAVLGITGYRRATRLARTITGQDRLVLSRQDRPVLASRARPARAAVRGPEPAALSRGDRAEEPAAGGRPRRERMTSRRRREMAAGAARSAVSGAAATAGFVRDVRAGMAEYGDLRRGEAGRSPRSRSDQVLPGESEQGRRQP
jgi:hypothetical protein